MPAGTVVADRFVLGEVLGKGGLAWVAAAHDRVLDQDVALKFLLPQYLDQPVVRERFRREVVLSRRLDHPGIVRVFDLFETDDQLLFSMARCPGRNLKEWMLTAPPPDADARLELVRQLLAALSAAHAAGVVHRDLKPQNVMRTPEGRLQLLDFGLARVESMATLTSHSVMMGTPDYLAPESITGLPVDGRADLYSLGVMWFELATGHLPTSARTPLQLLDQKRLQDGPAPGGDGVTAQESAVVAQLLRRLPQDRPASATEVLELLDGDPTALALPIGTRVCARCGAQAHAAPPFCLGCGADWSSAEALAGDAMLVLMRADNDADALQTALLPFGIAMNPTEADADPLAVPRVLLRGVDADLARAMQQALVAERFSCEVRREDEDNFDLLHRTGTPGFVFVAGLLCGWTAACALGWALAGTVGLCVALAAGPPFGWLLQRRAAMFLAPHFLVQTREGSGPSLALSKDWRVFLAQGPPGALRTVGEGLMLRAHLLTRAAGERDVATAVRDSVERSASAAVGAGVRALLGLVEVERALEAEDPRRLYDELEAAAVRARFATAPQQAEAEASRRTELQAAIDHQAQLDEERTRGIQRVLALCSSLDRLRRTLRQPAALPDQLTEVRLRLDQDAQLLSETRRELELKETA